MKRTTLLVFIVTILITSIQAQKRAKKNEQKPIGYAITGTEKGQTGWREVRLVDVSTGEELKTIYKSDQEVEILNARTGKPVVKKDLATNQTPRKKVVNLDMELDKKEMEKGVQAYTVDANKNLQPTKIDKAQLEEIQLAVRNIKTNINTNINNKIDINTNVNNNVNVHTHTIVICRGETRMFQPQTDKPFATNSAAAAYDKKHERLYYTPMGINQLRYIDLKSNKIYYFEDEPFGTVSGLGDGSNQIPRMVIASDGDGYALSNNCDHLMKFGTGKKQEITDLGALTDDPANGKFSVRNSSGYGGDMIADANNNLYLITGNRKVYKIPIETKVATYMGTIQGLPQGFTTNGAMVESGSKVIVCSAQSTEGYFRFDLTTMQAEKMSESSFVFNASDLANGNLAFEKEKKKKNKEEQVEETPVTEEPLVVESKKPTELPVLENSKIMIYPNPVTNGLVKLSFQDQPVGRYQVQFMDISGRVLSTKNVNINSNLQIEEFRLPEFMTAGNYLVKVIGESNKVVTVNKLIVQPKAF